jgi:hypothetical protein
VKVGPSTRPLAHARTLLRLAGSFAGPTETHAVFITGTATLRVRTEADVTVTLHRNRVPHAYTGRDFEHSLGVLDRESLWLETAEGFDGAVEIVR